MWCAPVEDQHLLVRAAVATRSATVRPKKPEPTTTRSAGREFTPRRYLGRRPFPLRARSRGRATAPPARDSASTAAHRHRLGSSRGRSPSRRAPPGRRGHLLSRATALEGFIDSLAAATTRPVEVVLADNGSTDGVPERAAAAHPHVTPAAHRRQHRLRRGRQRRRSPTAPRARRWSPTPTSASSPARSTSCWPRRSAGRARPRSGRPSARRRASSTPPRATCRGFDRRRARPARLGVAGQPLDGALPARAGGAARAAGRLAVGSCLLVDLAAFASVGGFDPGYFMYFEDVDLAERLGRARVAARLRAVGRRRARGRARHPPRAAPHAAGAPHQRAALPGPAVPAAPATRRCGWRSGPGSAPGCWSPTSAAGWPPVPASSAGADGRAAGARGEGLTCATR